ncbi:MAG: EamA family transporter [Chloroflexi bacterium]|nr:EamA family transporter [Chloroflexota bacterium]
MSNLSQQDPSIRLDRASLSAFVLMVLIGGSNAVAVRFSNLELPPFWGAATRFVATALIFWLVIFSRRLPLPKGRALIGALLFGFLSVGASYAFLYWALVHVQAGLSMVILALGPLLTFFFAWAHGLEAFRWRGLLGSLLAFGGIFIGVGGEIGTTVAVTPLLALLAGAACIAEGSIVFKLFPKSEPLVTNALAVSTGALVLVVVSVMAGEPRPLPATPTTWAAFLYLVFIGSVVLFYLYLYVLDRWTASGTSYAFLLFPVSAVVVGAWLAGEVVSPRFLLGGLLVLLGVWVGALAPEKSGRQGVTGGDVG